MNRVYKNWTIVYHGRDKNGSYWMVTSPINFLNKGETGDPLRRHTEVLNSLHACKLYIDKWS